MKRFCVLILMLLLLTGCAHAAYVPAQRSATLPPTRTDIPDFSEGPAFPVQYGVTDSTNPAMLVNYVEVTRTPWLVMYADMTMGAFAIKNIETDYIWYSVPPDILLDETTRGAARLNLQSQMIINFIFRQDANTTVVPRTSNSQSGVVNQHNVTVNLIENGIRVEFFFELTGFRIPVEYRIIDDFFEAMIDVANIDEGELCYLLGINLLPSFGAGNLEDEGYLFIPDGSGVLVPFNMNFQMTSPYEEMVYGRDYAVVDDEMPPRRQNIHMPVFGTLRDNQALMGVITEGDGAASILLVNGNASMGYNAVSTRMIFRHSGRVQSLFMEINGNFPTITQVSHAPNHMERYTVRYYFLSGDEADYVGMAHRYRGFLINERGLVRNPQSPALALELYGSIDIVANRLGFMYNRDVPLTTYRQAVDIVEMLRALGIHHITLRYVGWDTEGTLNRRLPNRANPTRILGGRRDFNDMLTFFQNEGIAYYFETDPIRFRSGGGRVQFRRDAARSPHRIPAQIHGYDLVTHTPRLWLEPYRLVSPTVLTTTATRFADNFNRLGATGISPGIFGEMLYSDYSESGGVFRSHTTDIYEGILSHYRDLGLRIATSGANVYTVPFAERIFGAPVYSSAFDIFGLDVPFYQIVFQGWVTMTAPAMMQSTRPEITFLKTVETGMELLYTGMYAEPDTLLFTRFDHLFSSTVSLWAARAAAQVARYTPLQQVIYNQEIIQHTRVAPGVSLTVFENGIHVLVNFTDYDTVYQNHTVPALDFNWWKG
ncbi:MAG: DUF5696 domain-containing protein [Defluviitaleaceae bacterium]|nr:DUF5696 domain-containing protein [Defluviitaleaceae bacterium]